MAHVYAVKSGNWSDTTVWNTGALPTSADDVWSNTYTVAIDGNYTVRTLQNGYNTYGWYTSSTLPTGITVGGWFTLPNGITFTATLGIYGGFGNINPESGVISCAITSGQTANVVSPIILSGSSNAGAKHGIWMSGGGTLNVVGNLAGGYNANCVGLKNSSSGTVNITGSCSGGAQNYSHGLSNTSTGTVNITGDCYAGVSAGGYNNWCQGVDNTGSGYVYITGNVYGSSSFITSAAMGYGVANRGAGYMEVVGPIYAGAGSAGVGHSTSIVLTGPFTSHISGTQGVATHLWTWKNGSAPTYMTIPSSNIATFRTLYTPDYTSGLYMPSTANVRANVVYGPSNELTGTCIIPPTASVRVGVPVDNTVGTAAITAADFWNYPRANANVADSMGERLANCATIESTGDQIRYLL